MEISVVTPGQSDASATISISPVVFDCPYREDIIHQVFVAYQARARAGTKANKSRSDVSGGGAKPWRQKGTGRARAGTTRGPIWRKGGVTFAARPRDYSQKVNRKVYRYAMRSILSELIRQDRLIVVDQFEIDVPKTGQLLEQFKLLSLSSALVVIDQPSNNLALAINNLSHFDLLDVLRLNPVALIGSHKVLVTVPAIKKIEAWLG